MVFEKNAKFFAENWQKSQKSVIITSTLGANELQVTSELQRQRCKNLQLHK
jgi:hypothetical protein